MLTKSTFLLVLGVAMAMANMNNLENLQLLNVDFNDENGQLQFAKADAIGQFQCLGYPCEEELNQNGVPIDGQCWVLVSQPRPSQATHSPMG